MVLVQKIRTMHTTDMYNLILQAAMYQVCWYSYSFDVTILYLIDVCLLWFLYYVLFVFFSFKTI